MSVRTFNRYLTKKESHISSFMNIQVSIEQNTMVDVELLPKPARQHVCPLHLIHFNV